jgi:hypothetical protein
MHRIRLTTGLLMAVSMSTFLVACGGDEDTLDRAALERESLERELELALQPDTTQQVALTDVALEVDEPLTPPLSTPAPAPRSSTQPRTPAQSTAPRQSAPSPAPSQPSQPRVVSYPVPAGTTFGVRLDEGLSTRSHSAGSTFTATLTEPILAANGSVLIPAGASVRGQVVESRASGRAGEDAGFAIQFTSISHGGRTYSISGSATDTPVRLVTRDSRTEQVAKVGGGAAVGAVLGRVIGGSTRSTVAGAAIGAAAGTAVAIGTADVDAVVDPGSQVTVRLDRSVTVERQES